MRLIVHARKTTTALMLVGLVGCAAQQQKAPVIERTPGATRPAPPVSTPAKSAKKAVSASTEKDWRPEAYTVKKGDTLYAIGLEFGFDYKDIARWNNIQPPYVIKVGQALKLRDTAKPAETPSSSASSDGVVVTPIKIESTPQPKAIGESSAKPESKPASEKIAGEPPLKTEPKAIKEPWSEQATAPAKTAEPVPSAEKPAEKTPEKPPLVTDDETLDWGWPAQGKVISVFTENGKGLDIGGELGQAVLAAAPGKVVYSGSSLRGYGKLVIIKHNKTYLTAYAHNQQMLVKEGQEVTKGQKIAEMGSTDADRVKLHFEIRKLGKPVDPEKYMPAR